MAKTEADQIMDALLKLYDWHVRFTQQTEEDDYQAGYTDAIGQCILDTGKILGEEFGKPYKYEAYKRVMQYENTAKYWQKYPKPLSDVFPAEVIRDNGGKL